MLIELEHGDNEGGAPQIEYNGKYENRALAPPYFPPIKVFENGPAPVFKLFTPPDRGSHAGQKNGRNRQNADKNNHGD